MGERNKWFPFKGPEQTEKKIKVFCFHHAGGTASTYRKWTLKEAPVKFVCIELPGKGTRRSEKFVCDFKLLLESLADNIVEEAGDEKICFFGHSMGAAMAFYIACRIKEKYKRNIEKLIVAGRQAPDEENLLEFKTYMDDNALISELKKYEATPVEILENKELLEFIIQDIRRDYKLNESLIYNNEKLDIPIIAHSGKYDDEANKEIMNQWRQMTSKDFKLKEFEGNHFFVTELGYDYRIQLIQDILS